MSEGETSARSEREEIGPDELTLMLGVAASDASAAWFALGGGQVGTGTLPTDLPGALATAAVLHLCEAGLARPRAAALVANHWPEWARAILAGAEACGLLPTRRRTSGPASSTVVVYPRGGLLAGHEAGKADDAGHVLPHGSGGRPHKVGGGGVGLVVDCATLLPPLALREPGGTPVATTTAALERLDLTFGRDERGRGLPLGSSQDEPGPGFLHRGPYLERAEELLRAPQERFEPDRHPGPAAWLAHLLDYAVEPPPLDHRKAHAGIGDGGAELWLLLVASVQVRRVAVAYKAARDPPVEPGRPAGHPFAGDIPDRRDPTARTALGPGRWGRGAG